MVVAKKEGTEKHEVHVKPKAVDTVHKAAHHTTAKLLSVKGQSKGDVALPATFQTEYRPDLILRAFTAEQSWERQPYGSDPRAGFRTTADYYGRRKKAYRVTMNKGMSRLPRQKRPKGGLGEVRYVPQSKGGHRAHPPKAEKIWIKKMNEKEWVLALKSAIAATTNDQLLTAEGRNHTVKSITLPLIVEKSFEGLNKSKDVYDAFEKLGIAADVERAAEKKTKSGKARTGKQKLGKSVLIVVSGDCALMNAGANLAGVDVIDAEGLSVTLLAPGGHAGRLTIWTEAALEKLLK